MKSREQVIQWLDLYAKNKWEIERRNVQITSLKNEIKAVGEVGAVKYDSEIRGTDISDPTSKNAEKRERLQAEINRCIEDRKSLEVFMRKIKKTCFDNLPVKNYQVIVLKWFDKLKDREILEIMDYSGVSSVTNNLDRSYKILGGIIQ